MNFYYVYLLQCNDQGFYTGYTENIFDRLARHQRGSVPATQYKRPITMLSYFSFSDKYKALAFEK